MNSLTTVTKVKSEDHHDPPEYLVSSSEAKHEDAGGDLERRALQAIVKTEGMEKEPVPVASSQIKSEDLGVQPVAKPLPSSQAKAEEPTTTPSSRRPQDMKKEPRESVWDLLRQAKEPGVVSTSGTCSPLMSLPGLTVDGVGPVSLPFSVDSVAQNMKQLTETDGGVVAQSGRVQINQDRFHLSNPRWHQQMQVLAEGVCDELGVATEDSHVEAQLEKLMLLHADDNGSALEYGSLRKEDRVFGTMVVVLPSMYEGGAICINHAFGTIESEENDAEPQKYNLAEASPYSTQYVAFFSDCHSVIHQEVTKGYQAVLVYNLVQTDVAAILPSADCHLSILRSLKVAASNWARDESWNTGSGKKLVIMTDDIPNGDRNSMIRLLEMAQDAGIDLNFERCGSVCYNEEGYAEQDFDYWHRRPRGDYEWSETTSSELVVLMEDNPCGEVPIAADELVPENFFDSKDPDDESIDSTGHQQVCARRHYSSDAIVVWPRSRGWEALTGSDMKRMSQFLLPEPNSDLAKILGDRILAESWGSFRSNRDGVLSEFMDILTKAEIEMSVGVNFWKQYMDKQLARIPNEIISRLSEFMHRYGSIPGVQSSLTSSVGMSTVSSDPNGVIQFVVNCFQKIGEKHAPVIQRMARHLVDCMHATQKSDIIQSKSRVNSKSITDFLAIFDGDHEIPDGRRLVCCFLDAVVQSSIQPIDGGNSRHVSSSSNGPTFLLDTGLMKICDNHGWKALEEVVTRSVEIFIEHGSITDALKFVTQLACPIGSDVTSEKHKVCAKLAARVVGESLEQTRESLSLKAFLDIFMLSQGYCPSECDKWAQAVLKQDIVQILGPIAVDLSSPDMSSLEVKLAISKIALECAKVLSTRVSVPLGEVPDWSLDYRKCVPRIAQYHNVDTFLASPCKESCSIQLAAKYHKQIVEDLRSLTASGDISLSFCQPDGQNYWHVKIVKHRHRRVPISVSSTKPCSCWSSEMSKCTFAQSKVAVERQLKEKSLLDQLILVLPEWEAKNISQKRTLHVHDQSPRKKAKRLPTVDIIDLTED